MSYLVGSSLLFLGVFFVVTVVATKALSKVFGESNSTDSLVKALACSTWVLTGITIWGFYNIGAGSYAFGLACSAAMLTLTAYSWVTHVMRTPEWLPLKLLGVAAALSIVLWRVTDIAKETGGAFDTAVVALAFTIVVVSPYVKWGFDTLKSKRPAPRPALGPVTSCSEQELRTQELMVCASYRR